MSSRQYKIVAPLNPEKPIKYVRKSIDYTILDDIGHGLHARQKQRPSAPTNTARLDPLANAVVGPPPTTKPPTPPQLGRGGTLKPGMIKAISKHPSNESYLLKKIKTVTIPN